MPDFALLLPAGGQSSRFGGGKNKLTQPLAGVPVLLCTLRAFLERADVPLIVLPVAEALREWVQEQVHRKLDPALAQRVRCCPGGPSRAHSVRNALERVPDAIEFVAVHDAARPLVSQELIDRTLAAAVEQGAAAPALPVALTIKQAVGPLPARILRTVPRSELWALQTPQIMRRSALARAYEQCPLPLDQVTDDLQLLELIGQPACLVAGEERNLKITTTLDLHIAEMLVARQE
jgi:2-C-methyl-D-erythritol 4-phosphate cytidylyltransferase